MIILLLLLLSSVPQPYVYTTLVNSTGHLFSAGTSLTFKCILILYPYVNNNERVSIEWSGLQSIPEDRYSLTATVTESTSSYTRYTNTLTISPLADQDDGQYICTGTVTGATSATSTGRYSISVTGNA